jgi:hypothetical protein
MLKSNPKDAISLSGITNKIKLNIINRNGSENNIDELYLFKLRSLS